MSDWVQVLRDYKKMSGLSFIDLGKKIGLSSSTVRYAHNQTRGTTANTKETIVDFLKKEKMLVDQAENYEPVEETRETIRLKSALAKYKKQNDLTFSNLSEENPNLLRKFLFDERLPDRKAIEAARRILGGEVKE